MFGFLNCSGFIFVKNHWLWIIWPLLSFGTFLRRGDLVFCSLNFFVLTHRPTYIFSEEKTYWPLEFWNPDFILLLYLKPWKLSINGGDFRYKHNFFCFSIVLLQIFHKCSLEVCNWCLIYIFLYLKKYKTRENNFRIFK